MAFIDKATMLGTCNADTGDAPGQPADCKFIAPGEDISTSIANRPHLQLAENTDFLRAAINRDLGLPTVGAFTFVAGLSAITIDPSGGAGGDVNYTGTLYLGESGWSGQERFDQLFQVLDENYQEVAVGGVEAKVTGLSGGNSLGDGFVSTLTILDLNVVLPAGNYRIGYYEGTDLENLPPYAFTHAGLRGLEEVGGELKGLKARLEVAELTAFSGNSIDVDPTASGGGDYDLSPAGFLYLGGSAYSGGGQEEYDYLFQLLDENGDAVIVNGQIVKINALSGTGSPALGSGFWDTDVVTLGLNTTVPSGNYRLLLPRNDNVTDLAEDGIYKGMTRYAHNHSNLKGVTATLSDGTVSVGGDHNGPNSIDVVDNYTYGGRFLLRRGNYEWSAISSMTKPNVTVIGELLQFGADTGANITSIEIPAAATGDFDLYGHYENILFSSKNSSYEYRFRNATLRNCDVQSGMGIIIGRVDWRDCGTGYIRTGNSPSMMYGILVTDDFPYKPSGVIEECGFYPPSPGGTAAAHFFGLSGSSSRHLVFRNCVFDGSFLGEGARIETSQLDLRFENCSFIGHDGAYALNADYVGNRNLTFVNCTFWNDYGQVIKYNGDTDLSSGERPAIFQGCSFVAGGSAPTAWAAMVSMNGAFKMEDCVFYVGDSAIIENPATAAAPTLQFGTTNGTHSYVIRDCRVEMAAWHGYTPIIFYGSDADPYEAQVDNFTVDMSSASALSYDRSTSGFIRAAIIEFIGLAAAGRTGQTVFGRNISIFGVASGSTVDDSGALFAMQYGKVEGLTIDGAASQGTNVFTDYPIRLGVMAVLRDINLFPGDVINFSDTSGRVIYMNGSDILVDGGRIHDVPTSFQALFYYFGSDQRVKNVEVDVSSFPATARVASTASPGSCQRNVFEGNHVYIGNLNSGVLEFVDDIGVEARVANNTFDVASSGTGALQFTALTSNRCLVDGNLVRRAGATSVAVGNTGTDSVTGDNVLAV